MAKLCAHGRELLRVSKRVENPDPDTTWRKITYSYHADGKFLVKRDFATPPNTFHPNGDKYPGSWKLAGKWDVAKLGEVIAFYESRGYLFEYREAS